MRLIDADVMIKVLNEQLGAVANNDFITGLRNQLRGHFLEFVKAQPTIDPVKHGEWAYVDKCHIQEWQAINKCSVCGRSVCDATYGDKVVHFNYCPHCGSDMRGDSK